MSKCASRFVRELAEYRRVINHLNNKTNNFTPVKVDTTDNFVFTIINNGYTTPTEYKNELQKYLTNYCECKNLSNPNCCFKKY